MPANWQIKVCFFDKRFAGDKKKVTKD